MSTFDFSFLFLLILICYQLTATCNAAAAITFEEYEQLKGDDFCSKDESFLVKICVKIAELNSITGYQSELLFAQCTSTPIRLYHENGTKVTFYARLLECMYQIPSQEVNIPGHGKLYTEPTSVLKAVGKGKEEKDVMEYVFTNSQLAEPFINRPDVLNEIQRQIEEEMHEIK